MTTGKAVGNFNKGLSGDDIEMGSIRNGEESTDSSAPDMHTDVTEKIMHDPLGHVNTFMDIIEDKIKEICKRHKKILACITYLMLSMGFTTYLIAACIMNFPRARALLCLTITAAVCIIYWLVKKYFGDVIIKDILKPLQIHFINRFSMVLKWSFVILFILFVFSWIIYDSVDNPERLISLAGLFIYIFIGFLLSANRSRIKWRPVLWGFALQFVFGLLILRTNAGYGVFKWIGDRITIFLGFSSEGSIFLFRDLPQFAFTILPVIAYFSSFTYLVWYLGIIQVVIKKIAWLLEITMGTSPAESFNAAGNIFIGQTEAPLLIRPFLEGMTESELHAVMTGGFATISGSVLAIYIHFGISATHLLSASIMSAPAALAMSKLMYPEVEEPSVKSVEEITVETTNERNVFEAIAEGATMSISLVASMVVNLIAFLSLLKCANSILGWLGSMVGEPAFSFEFICSYALMPFAYIMGVSWDDSFIAAELLGVKTFLNEFVAYQRLSVYIKNRETGSGNTLSIRSEVIITYALCGFANFGAMGIVLGCISSLVPSKRGVLAKHLLRALVAGTLACFMTACIAGLLYETSINNVTTVSASRNTSVTTNGTVHNIRVHL